MPVKVLVVIDGDFRFAEPAISADFTFAKLTAALSGAGFEVTKANRSNDTTAPGIIPNFNFQTSGNLLDYDVVWMIGREGRNSVVPPGQIGPIDPPQLNAIAQFMEAGGGVFVTGDHDSIGAAMCGQIPRVRAMRSWYGASDPQMPPGLASVPANFPPLGTTRADTTLINPMGTYPANDAQNNAFVTPYTYFENQSDTLPQTIAPATSPTHPILRNNGHDIVVYPDHMHEGQTHGVIAAFDYTQPSPFGDTSKAEFREIAGHRELPQVIATGQTQQHAVYYVGSLANAPLDPAISAANTVNSLSVYDGRVAGVGRIVAGSTFHHYIDINLSGDSTVNTPAKEAEVGPDAEKNHGLTDNSTTYGDITAVFANITQWLARPRPVISLILERSTFSQDEVTATPNFPGAILVTVDGLKPSQFPGGGITSLSPSASDLMSWAPSVTPQGGVPISIVPTEIDSDDPALSDRLQRFTFTYRVNFTGNAFGFGPGTTDTVPVQASLTSSAIPAPLTDMAWIELVKSANPFMLDLADGNQTTWLSSDIKVFHVVEGGSFQGFGLPANATRDDALAFLRNVVSTIDTNQFTSLLSTEAGSVLSVAAVTATNPPKRVYNFALARVRLSSAGADAPNVRVFFRIFVSQTTAALTYHLDGSGVPLEGYSETSGANPIAVPGTQNGGTQWLTFPFFSADRMDPPNTQTDPDNVRTVYASNGYRIFGALIDNNLDDAYLTQTPVSGGSKRSLPTILMGAHQCVVAQIDFGGTPIPDGANPATSDKLSQRNLAISTVANPGLSASRIALHTFEIEATPRPITSALPPDELLLEWSKTVPKGTYLRLHIPSWSADNVVELADRLYARHEIRAVGAHTIEVPGGGARYVPIPRCLSRQTGVIVAELPLGIRKGQRFDVSMQQITNRLRSPKIPPPRIETITREQARKLLAGIASNSTRGAAAKDNSSLPRGVFDLGGNRVLVTDLTLLDDSGDHAIIVQHPDPKIIAAAQRDAGRWRATIGAFTLGIPVSTRGDMLLEHLQLLSIMTWRAEYLDRNSFWRPTLAYYLALLADKVRALGGDPFSTPPTPDGDIPQLHRKEDECCHCHKKYRRDCDEDDHRNRRYSRDHKDYDG